MADSASERRVHTYCGLCIARCGAVAVVEGGRFTRLEPDPSHPTGQALCAKGRAAPELVYHTQRLTRPLRRTRPKTEPSASSPPAAISRHPPARKVRNRLPARAKGIRTLDPAGGGELSSRVLHRAALGRVPPTPGAVAQSQVYAGGGTKPPISVASSRANAIVVGSSPSGPMICRPTGNPSAVKPIGAAVAGR